MNFNTHAAAMSATSLILKGKGRLSCNILVIRIQLLIYFANHIKYIIQSKQ